MTVVALCSTHGAPGVTTGALALAWVWPTVRQGRRVLLVDADPAGSGLLTGYLRAGVPHTAGVSSLAAARPPLSPEQVVGCCVALDGDGARMVLPGVADPMQARPLAATWSALVDVARELSDRGIDVVVDVGRVGHRLEPSPWLTEADVLAVVVRGDLASVVPAAAAVRSLAAERTGHAAPIGVVVDPGRYSTGDIATALGVPEAFSLPRDDWAARAFAEGGATGWRFDRAPLLRAAGAFVEHLGVLAPERGAVTR